MGILIKLSIRLAFSELFMLGKIAASKCLITKMC